MNLTKNPKKRNKHTVLHIYIQSKSNYCKFFDEREG